MRIAASVVEMIHRILFSPLPALALALLGACATAPRQAAVPAAETALQPPAALHTEGLPPVPQRLLAPIQRWTAVSGHDFVDWHPTRREMLVSHRPPGASTTQLFRVRAPLTTPEPLTDGADPVRLASWEPLVGRYIVFARGSAGNEAFQLFRLD
ncbi:MAG TPA: S9 family peptidase, partial [Rubrivivax sp.]|nr:S9 family peptidase [Rubrivivax sp.]